MIIGKNHKGYTSFYHDQNCLYFEILPKQRNLGDWLGKEVGYVHPKFHWI
jgi:hypothetical protein